ncbi:MAG: hypothetical protein GSR85_11295 [Desulfurococcales archaeon]|nr:hypothetical protein [Desulfurococcales archaeon]
MEAGFVKCGVRVEASISGCSCLLLKRLALLGGFKHRPSMPWVSVSPLFTGGKPLLEWVDGWVDRYTSLRLRLRGWYWFRVGFAGFKDMALELCKAVIRGARVMGWEGRIEGMEVIGLDEVEEGWGGVWFKLVTPAQFKALTVAGSLVISNPSPQLLLRAALKLLGEEGLGEWVVQVKGGFKPVTAVLDEGRLVWGVVGEGVLMPLKSAPDRVVRALYKAAMASKYIGVGKSRLSGLGQAEFRLGVSV